MEFITLYSTDFKEAFTVETKNLAWDNLKKYVSKKEYYVVTKDTFDIMIDLSSYLRYHISNGGSYYVIDDDHEYMHPISEEEFNKLLDVFLFDKEIQELLNVSEK